MFVRQGMLLTSIGVVAGLFVSFGVMRHVIPALQRESHGPGYLHRGVLRTRGHGVPGVL